MYLHVHRLSTCGVAIDNRNINTAKIQTHRIKIMMVCTLHHKAIVYRSRDEAIGYRHSYPQTTEQNMLQKPAPPPHTIKVTVYRKHVASANSHTINVIVHGILNARTAPPYHTHSHAHPLSAPQSRPPQLSNRTTI